MRAVCGFILICFFLSGPQVFPNAHKEEAPFSSFSHRNLMDMLALPFFFIFFFSFLRGDDVSSVRIQSGGSSISHNAIPPKVYDSRNWRISRSSSSFSSSSCAATSPRSAVRSRRI
ncbi:unnamed protein product, partial [Sphagnum tenellum]